ncbi:hypothetical protein AB0368_29220 [Actinoplanes sp. NPDC051475]|uniref:hypothetical protein n=1 Tax=Actinoplanes sp. NPDC051475 TaxID=3157225 RepID=UPI00344C9AE4
MEPARSPNQALAHCLAELGWSPRTLARRINDAYGAGTISASAPYHWRDRSRVPYPPVCGYAAQVLADALGRPVAAADLWQGRAAAGPVAEPGEFWATAGPPFGAPGDAAPDSGVLADIAWGFLEVGPGRLAGARDAGGTGAVLVDQLERGVAALREAAETVDGADALGHVAAQYQAVSLLLRQGGRSDGLTRRLVRALGELAQLGAWLAMDADRPRESRGYLVVALRAAREAGDRRLAAHVLRDLAGNVEAAGRVADAVRISEAARQAAPGRGPTSAFIAGQLAYAYARHGAPAAARRTAELAAEWLAAKPSEGEPEWVHRLAGGTTGPMVARTLVQLAHRDLTRGRPAAARSLLRRGIALLDPASAAGSAPATQRAALYEGIYLADAHVVGGDLEEACAVGRVAVERQARVRSPRGAALLRALCRDLVCAGPRNRSVMAFRADISGLAIRSDRPRRRR